MRSVNKLFLGLLVILITACAEADKREPAIYLLPENYKGSFYIIFNIPKGKFPKYENDSRIYEIPENGILLTQADTNEGWIDRNKVKFFYVDGDGSRTEITERWTTSLHDTPENRGDNRITIFGGGVGVFEPINGCQVYEQPFIIGTKSDVLDGKVYFDIYGPKGIKDMDKSIFKDACNDQ